MPVNTSPFALPARLSAKTDPRLIAADEHHFAAIPANLARTSSALTARLDIARAEPAGPGQAALDRDAEVHRLSSRLGVLRRFGIDLCLGRMVRDDGETVYIGRGGLADSDGRRLLVDWRAPAAEPFFAASHGDPRGLVSRRRYRWNDGRITDYWDEVFDLEAIEGSAALDDQSAFVASLGASRSPRMRDVLATIQADQDAIVRADSRGALVVDGGPGTGKTVVALHRAAFLLYADPRLAPGSGGVLFVGPHEPYLDYVEDVLPSLGEENVATCTLRDLVPEGRGAVTEGVPEIARLKADARMLAAVERAVRRLERAPTRELLVETAVADIRISPADWREAFAAAEAGTTHNDARDRVWDALLDLLAARGESGETTDGWAGRSAAQGDPWAEGWGDARWTHSDEEQFDAYGRGGDDQDGAGRAALAADGELRAAFARVWPLLEPADVVRELWTSADVLRACAPWLDPAEVDVLQRPTRAAWTTADLPLLDAARMLVGDPDAVRARHRRSAQIAVERERMTDVVSDLIAADDSDMAVMSMLRGQDMRAALEGVAVEAAPAADALAGPFAHIVVDEAQELTDAEWGMLLRRCPSRSLTIVGDRAQARRGFAETWPERLARVGIERSRVARLTVNYRTPEEIMTEAAPVIRIALPDANVPVSVRSAGVPVMHAPRADRDRILEAWLAEHDDGVVCVIGDPSFSGGGRVRSASPAEAKGLEFDLVVLVDPSAFGAGVSGAVDRYVAMTRATQRLVILT
ncbi:RNA polymerase recycling motor ATPase HelR [Microbacterium marinilacus]|uniref:RNA polymerase recycling motor ATPase HelR n=1 Tax=Microbacterium marinilacus TaxID=415209 RepID=UPI001C8D01D3|nr:AAA family ATPase [Microbacterium marinilacus]